METFFNFLIPISLVAVVLVLLAGLWNMMRGGSAGRSQTLMRWRVGLQFVAIIIVMTAFYITSN
ncbi:MAG TPA: twin transmembrane helix small protein [Rhodobiaceae bacterium]|nr:twin transmembrane helix small protein [Rhodobiaceae bacterium]